MRSAADWKPTKYVQTADGWRASRDPDEVRPASRLMADRIAQTYSELLPRYARGRLLDLGCGKVPLYGIYRDRVDEVLCVDWAESLHASPHLDRIHDLSQPLPSDLGSFDTIIFSDVLEHLPEPAQAWESLAGALRPGGHVLLNVPFLYWLHEVPHDFHRYTRYALERYARQVGLEVVLLEELGGPAEALVDLAAKSLLRRLPGERQLTKALIWLHEKADRWKKGRLLGGHWERMPYGYRMVCRKPS